MSNMYRSGRYIDSMKGYKTFHPAKLSEVENSINLNGIKTLLNKAENVIKIIGQVRELKKEDRDLIIKMLSELAKIYITTRNKNIRKIRK